MKQQSITDAVIKDLFGVSGNEFQEIKETIAGLALGELISATARILSCGSIKLIAKDQQLNTNS